MGCANPNPCLLHRIANPCDFSRLLPGTSAAEKTIPSQGPFSGSSKIASISRAKRGTTNRGFRRLGTPWPPPGYLADGWRSGWKDLQDKGLVPISVSPLPPWFRRMGPILERQQLNTPWVATV